MKTDVEMDSGRAEARITKIVFETSEDYALALQRIRILESGPRGGSAEHELTALNKAIEEWDGGTSRKRGYPM